MSGKSGLTNLIAMRGRRKGGAPTSQTHARHGIAAHADAFLENLTARAYSKASIEAHRWALRQFTTWAFQRGSNEPKHFVRADLEAYQLFLHRYRSLRGDKPLVVNTQLARLGCIRRFFAWLCRSGTIPANPAADLDLPRKQSRHLPKALNADEITRLLAIPNPADPFGLRDRTMLELFYATGIRRSEMTHLDHGDYEAATCTLVVRQGKGGKSRMLPVGERAAAWMDRYLSECRPLFAYLPNETALFLSGYGTRITSAYLGNWIKKLLKSCDIDKPGSCHLWRHTCATDMHRGGEICACFGVGLNVIRAAFESFGSMARALEERNLTPLSSAMEYVPTSMIELDEAQATEVLKLIDKGAPIKWALIDPALFTGQSIQLSKNAKNPNAAKLFIDYIISDEGQKILADKAQVPALPAALPAVYQPITKVKLVPQAHELEAEKADFFKAKMQEYFVR